MKNKETLEEVAERKFQNIGDILIFEDCAKWQQEQDKKLYSEEDMKNAFYEGWILRGSGASFRYALEKWFEQFKKK